MGFEDEVEQSVRSLGGAIFLPPRLTIQSVYAGQGTLQRSRASSSGTVI